MRAYSYVAIAIATQLCAIPIKGVDVNALMKKAERFEEIRRLEEEIAALREELEQAAIEFGLRHPKLISIAERLDPPIARLMKLKLEELEVKPDKQGY